MMFGLKQEILDNIKNILMKYEQVEKVLIFGSRARGDNNITSDIDIAIYCKGKFPIGLRLDIEEAVGIYKVDIIDMNNIHDEKLKFNIENQGKIIYCL